MEAVVSPSRSHTDTREELIRRERERRHWTIEQWAQDAPDEHWPTYMAKVRRDADEAVDALLADLQRLEEALRRIAHWSFDVSSTAEEDLYNIKDAALSALREEKP